MKRPLPRLRLLTTAFIALAGVSPMFAQAAAPAPAPAAAAPARAAPIPVEPKSGEVVQLSPFQVAADSDRGYQALNTLSGTRLNSKLEDLGSSITVVTKQQMTDLGMLDINDVFRYEASTEGTDSFTQFVRNRTGGVGDQAQSDPQQANRIRGLGAAAGTVDVVPTQEGLMGHVATPGRAAIPRSGR